MYIWGGHPVYINTSIIMCQIRPRIGELSQERDCMKVYRAVHESCAPTVIRDMFRRRCGDSRRTSDTQAVGASAEGAPLGHSKPLCVQGRFNMEPITQRSCVPNVCTYFGCGLSIISAMDQVLTGTLTLLQAKIALLIVPSSQ